MQVVNKLVAQKKRLAKDESLPGKFYDAAMEELHFFGCGLGREALKKRVNRVIAKESSIPPTPIPAAITFDLSATNESNELPTSALSSSIATASAHSTSADATSAVSNSNNTSDSSKKRGGRPRGTSRAEQDDAAKRYKECLNSITTAYANEKKISELTLKPMPISFLQDLIRKKKSEFNVAADIPHKTIFSRVLRNKSDPDKHKLNSMHPGTSSPLAAVEKTIVDIIIGMAQIRQPMTKTEVIKMMNDAISVVSISNRHRRVRRMVRCLRI